MMMMMIWAMAFLTSLLLSSAINYYCFNSFTLPPQTNSVTIHINFAKSAFCPEFQSRLLVSEHSVICLLPHNCYSILLYLIFLSLHMLKLS
jgi:hypothetical protein